MGQYFRLLNYDKREYVDPWDLGGVAKLWEWCALGQNIRNEYEAS